MGLVIKKVNGKDYYYSFLSYYLINKSKSFSKYLGLKKPSKKELNVKEEEFKQAIIAKVSGKNYTTLVLKKDEIIKTLLLSQIFNSKYTNMSALMRRKYDIDSTISFTLTTLTTEDVNVDLNDIKNAIKKSSRLSEREQISRNMLTAIESIRHKRKLDQKYLLDLHKMIMSTFEGKAPGVLRNRQVYLYRRQEYEKGGSELSYRPSHHSQLEGLLVEFVDWYNSTDLNPLEKAALAHYKLYKIHPFLDGNKRICRLIFNKTLIEEGFPLINISVHKEKYFDALAESVEKNDPRKFVDFTLAQYYVQVKEFLTAD